jgi:hypothetical protein
LIFGLDLNAHASFLDERFLEVDRQLHTANLSQKCEIFHNEIIAYALKKHVRARSFNYNREFIDKLGFNFFYAFSKDRLFPYLNLNQKQARLWDGVVAQTVKQLILSEEFLEQMKRKECTNIYILSFVLGKFSHEFFKEFYEFQRLAERLNVYSNFYVLNQFANAFFVSLDPHSSFMSTTDLIDSLAYTLSSPTIQSSESNLAQSPSSLIETKQITLHENKKDNKKDNKKNILWLSVKEFNYGVADHFKKVLSEAQNEKKVDLLIIDLRSNLGGLLFEVSNMISSLLPTGTTHTLKNNDGSTDIKMNVDGEAIYADICATTHSFM